MKLSRKAKRQDEGLVPGDFNDYELFQQSCPEVDGTISGMLRRSGPRVEIGHLALERNTPKKISFNKLQSKAENLISQVNYLQERLEIVDHDRRGMHIQLRSLPPYKDEHQIQFNEINLCRNRIQVKRVAFYRKEEVKCQVPLSLNEREFSRLMADIQMAIQ